MRNNFSNIEYILDIFHHFRKSGYGRCSKCSKTWKNIRKFKIQKKSEKINPKAFICHRFHLNSSTSAIFTALWNFSKIRIFRSIFRNVQKNLTLGDGICIQSKWRALPSFATRIPPVKSTPVLGFGFWLQKFVFPNVIFVFLKLNNFSHPKTSI